MLLVGMEASVDILENDLDLLKNLKMRMLYDPEIPFLGISPKNMKPTQKNYMLYSVYYSTFYNSQGMEATYRFSPWSRSLRYEVLFSCKERQLVTIYRKRKGVQRNIYIAK